MSSNNVDQVFACSDVTVGKAKDESSNDSSRRWCEYFTETNSADSSAVRRSAMNGRKVVGRRPTMQIGMRLKSAAAL
jgi:hypothetical protein